MKKVLFTLIALFVSSQLLLAQSSGKVVYGPNAKISTEQISTPAGGNVAVYSESAGKIPGFDPNPNRGETDDPLGGQFIAGVTTRTPTSFIVTVIDAGDCAGTYTVSCAPIAGSGPGGSTPPLTNITAYIGFPQGNFIFSGAGDGEYAITVTNTNGSCSPPTNPVKFKGWNSLYVPTYVPVAGEAMNIMPPSIPWADPGYTSDGNFMIHVSETGSCAGTYTIFCYPVPNSAPDGSTPPNTTIVGYIGFPAGNFYFGNAGTGQYQVTITETDPFTICNYTGNPLVLTVTVPDVREIPISNWALVLGIALIAIVAIIRFRRL